MRYRIMFKKLLTSAFVVAFASCTIAMAEISNEAKLHYNQGVDYYRAGQFSSAVNSFRKAISLDANYIDAYYNLGVILQQMNNDAEALNVFKQIMVRKPNDYEAVYNAAALSYKLGQTDNAKKYLALIPATSPVITKARTLASNMNTDLQTISTELKAQAEANVSKVPQENGNYTDIPSPTGVTTDKFGNIYVASFSENSITKITPIGARSTVIKGAQLNGPIDIECDNEGNLYVANYNTDNIVKVTPAGVVTQLLGNVPKPYCLHISGNVLFISSQGSNAVIRYKI